jgi:hypothetical protein
MFTDTAVVSNIQFYRSDCFISHCLFVGVVLSHLEFLILTSIHAALSLGSVVT